MLALIHRVEGCFNIHGLGDSCHGGSEEDANAKGQAQQERISRLNSSLGPGCGTLAIHAEGDLQSQGGWGWRGTA